MIDILFGMIVDWEGIKWYKELVELLDKDKLDVYLNDFSPVWNDCRLGRYKHQINFEYSTW